MTKELSIHRIQKNMPIYNQITIFTRPQKPQIKEGGDEITIRTQQVGEVGIRREFGRITEAGDELHLFAITTIGGEASEEPLLVKVDGNMQHTLFREEINKAAELNSYLLHPRVLKHEVGWQEIVPEDPSSARRK